MTTFYESEEEYREIIIDAFDKSTGRGDFLRKILATGAGVAAAGVGAGLLTTTHVSAAELGLDSEKRVGALPATDLAILNYALTLEHIEATFYRQAYAKGEGPTKQIRRYVGIIARHEKMHVDALTAAIQQNGGMPVKEQMYTFPPLTLTFGVTVENLGVRAYLGAAPMVKTPAVLLTAASIVTVEARHAAAWATLNHDVDFTKGAFDSGLDMGTVVKAVTPFFAK